MKKVRLLILGLVLCMAFTSCKEDEEENAMKPAVDFTFSPATPRAGDEVKFTAESQTGSSVISSWKWSFGDPLGTTSIERNPAFTFQEEGSFEVQLEAKDASGQVITVKKTVAVAAAPATAFPATLTWTFENNTPVTGMNDASGPAIDDNGVIYYVEGFAAANSKMVAVNDGGAGASLKWANSYGHDLRNAPAIGTDGNIYIGKWTTSAITKINASTGAMIWEKATNNSGASNSTTAIDAAGNIYFASRVTASVGGIFSFTPDGTQRWALTTPSPGATYSSPAISKDGKTVYFYSSGPGHMIALNTADGSHKWAAPVVASVGLGTALSINSDGTIYATSDTEIIAVTDGGANGSIKWKTAALGPNSSGVVIGTNGDLYVGSKEGLKALNPTDGTVKWSVPSFMEECVPAVDKNGNVYFGNNEGKFIIVNQAGEIQKEISLGNSTAIVHTPTIHDNGSVYVEVYEAGKIKLCKIVVTNGGPANSPWPMKGQNRKHTGHAK